MYIDSFMFGGGFEIMFTLIFITVFGLIIFTIIRGIGEWNKNNQSPRLTVEASIVAADGPTAIFIAGKIDFTPVYIGTAILVLITAGYMIYRKNKKGGS